MMLTQSISRRNFLGAVAASATASVFSIGRAKAQQKGRVVMLGFDGMEPSIVEAMIEKGELPNLALLQQRGGMHRLTTTIPPQSPVAWNSFATCQNPGAHNIFDFIRRKPRGPAGPLPLVGTGRVDPPTLAPDGSLVSAAQATNYRKGVPFWSVADEQGLRAKSTECSLLFPAGTVKKRPDAFCAGCAGLAWHHEYLFCLVGQFFTSTDGRKPWRRQTYSVVF